MLIAENLINIQKRIKTAEKLYHRSPNSVRLLAVSKFKPIELIQSAATAGQRSFGENYVQEAIPKIMALAHLNLEWHFIGSLQVNKTKLLATYFDWVQSIADIKIARRLHDQRPHDLPPLNICIQVNVSGENSKSGIVEAQLEEFVNAVIQLPRLKLRGLMCIPAATDNFDEQLRNFTILQTAYEQLKMRGLALDTLSMGMTHDLEAAIAAGSTMVRVGEGIFGKRI